MEDLMDSHDTAPESASTASANQATTMLPLSNKPASNESPTSKREVGDDQALVSTTTAKKGSTIDIDGEIADIYNQLPPLPTPAPKAHPRFVHCMPPEAPTYREYSVYLAGSIEMGAAVQWQKTMVELLSPLPITVNNPRRGHWNPNATQEAKNAEFRHQVEWELAALEKADVICFFFDVNTKSPVTMLELGIWIHSKNVVVCCDGRFWRAGNVHIVCQRYNIPYVESFAEIVPAIKKMLKEKGMNLDENGDLIR